MHTEDKKKTTQKKYFTKPVDSSTIKKINSVITGLKFTHSEKKNIDNNKYFIKKK